MTHPSKPTIEVTTLQSPDHPMWQLLMDRRDELKEDLKFFNPMHLGQLRSRTILVAQLDQCIAGLAVLHNDSTHHENAIGVGYVSTRKNFQNMGIATALVKALFTHAQLQGKAICNSKYEIEGEIYLKPVMERVANRFPTVEFMERDYTC